MSPKRSSQENFVKTALRVPPDLHAALHESAVLAQRSYNAEIVHRLQSSYPKRATAQKGNK